MPHICTGRMPLAHRFQVGGTRHCVWRSHLARRFHFMRLPDRSQVYCMPNFIITFLAMPMAVSFPLGADCRLVQMISVVFDWGSCPMNDW